MDNLKKRSKCFIAYLAIFSVILLTIIATTIYFVDPFFQYRVRDKQYLLNPIYVNTGLAKNYDYNTVIIGSSMAQNYDLGILRKDSLVKPVKLASGALTISEMKLLYSLVKKEKVNTFILNIDMVQFNEWMAPDRYPTYLYSGKPLDRLRYHFAYESVMRYLLVDLALYPYIATTKEEDIPIKLKLRYSIDDIGNFSQDAVYNDAERIKTMYKTGNTVSVPHIFYMNYRMGMNIDQLIETLELDKNADKEYIMVLPPYSALYWHITKEGKYYQHMINNLKHICRETEKYPNVRVQCFFNLESITDLTRYSDVTHFDPETSNYILENLRNDKYTLSTSNMHREMNKLDSVVVQYRKDNASWLNKK